MADTVHSWSTTAASNANSDSAINFTEGQAPSTLNNSDRAVMARVVEYVKDTGEGLAAGGSANVLTVTANEGFTVYANTINIRVKATATNTGAATLNVNAIGAKSIRTTDGAGNDVAISAGMICTGGVYDLVYSTALNAAAGGWWLLNPSNVTVGGGFPSCILSKSYPNDNTYQISSYAAWAQVPLDTEEYDNDSVMTLATNRFTSTVNGGVKCRVSVTISGSAVTYARIQLYNVTDATAVKGSDIVKNLASADNVGMTMSMYVASKIVAGKQYEIQIRGVRVSGTGVISYASSASLGDMGSGIPVSVEFYRT